jgi:sulfite reductase (NADPH) flavoprotein alpha-component
LSSLTTAFSRVPDGNGYVQDALRHDAARVLKLATEGPVFRVCGSRSMAKEVIRTLDDILAAAGLNVAHLKAGERYAEDVF